MGKGRLRCSKLCPDPIFIQKFAQNKLGPALDMIEKFRCKPGATGILVKEISLLGHVLDMLEQSTNRP